MRMHIYRSYGQDRFAVLIIHPMPSSASNTKTSLCDHMGSELCLLAPDLPAHGDKASVPYVSAATEAIVVHQWLVSNGTSCLSLGFAVSLGGMILFELLRFPDLSFDRLFIEGVSFYSSDPAARVGGVVLNRVVVVKHREAMRNSEAGVHKLQRLYSEEAARSMVVSFTAVSENSIHAIVRDCSHVSLPPLSPAIQRRCIFTHGGRDLDPRLARRMIPHLYPGAELHVWPGWGRCERISRDSVTYGAMLRNIALGSASTDRS